MQCGCSSESHSPLAVQSEGECEAAAIKSGLPPCVWEPEAVSWWLCSAFQGWQMQAFTGYERPSIGLLRKTPLGSGLGGCGLKLWGVTSCRLLRVWRAQRVALPGRSGSWVASQHGIANGWGQ